MTKYKQESLTKYKLELEAKIGRKNVPMKHKGHPNEYRLFLLNELRLVSNTLEAAKLEGIK